MRSHRSDGRQARRRDAPSRDNPGHVARSRPGGTPHQCVAAAAGQTTAAADPGHARAFGRKLRAWYRANARDLPWRRTRDPYRVLVSELMLQQTQVSRVVVKYAEFLERFPTLGDV